MSYKLYTSSLLVNAFFKGIKSNRIIQFLDKSAKIVFQQCSLKHELAQALVGISTCLKRCFESFFCKAGRCHVFLLIITSVDGLTGVLILWYLYTKFAVLLHSRFSWRSALDLLQKVFIIGKGSEWCHCSFIVNQFAILQYRFLIFWNVCNISLSQL